MSLRQILRLSHRGREGGEGKDRFEYPESGKEKSSTRSEPTSASAGEGKRCNQSEGTNIFCQTQEEAAEKVSPMNGLNRSNVIMANVSKEEIVVAVVPTKQKNLFKFQPHLFTRSVAQSQSTFRL